MEKFPFQSGDFAKVPAVPKADRPGNLLHKNLSGPESLDAGFSSDRRHLVNVAKLPSKVLSMTLGGLEPRQSTRKHRHNYETLIYVIEGIGRSIIEDEEIPWRAGDAFYVPVWAWHSHENGSETAKALYIACENAPMLQNLGIAVREEAAE